MSLLLKRFPGAFALRSVGSRLKGMSELSGAPLRSESTAEYSDSSNRSTGNSDPGCLNVYVQRLQGPFDGVAVIHMNRPEAKNAISWSLLKHFQVCVDSLIPDTSVRAVIIKSEVEGVFCAGADLRERLEMELPDVRRFLERLNKLVNDIAILPAPVIAAMDGSALGGGLELALACDIRVACTSAKLGLPEVKLAIIPGAGGTQRLPRLIGIAKAKELIYTGRVLSATEAANIGLVNCVVNLTEKTAYQRALEIAREILHAGPLAVKTAKFVIDSGMEQSLSSGLETEKNGYAPLLKTDDRMEGLRAFGEKRPPKFRGC